MSSFIVSQKCMNNIISGLFWSHEFKRQFNIMDNNGYCEEKDFQRLGDKLFKLNINVVNQRYADKVKPITFVWSSGSIVNKYQILKSMQCLRYQCYEGTIPKTKLFKLLTDIIDCWQSYIISGIEEYNKAKWD